MDEAKTAGGTVALLVAGVTTAALNYGFNLAMGWLLPPEGFGLLGVVLATLAILTLFVTAGFPWASAKFLAEHAAAPNGPEAHRLFRASLFGNLLVAVVTAAAFGALWAAGVVSRSLTPPAVALLVAVLGLSAVANAYRGALQGMFRFHRMALLAVLETAARFAVAAALVLVGFGVGGALGGLVAAAALATGYAAYAMRDLAFWRTPGWAAPRVFQFAAPMFAGSLALAGLINLDILALDVLGAESRSLGHYQGAIVLGRLPIFVVGTFAVVFFPLVSRHRADLERRRRYVGGLVKLWVVFAVPLALALALEPRLALRLVFPPEYAAAVPALRFLAPAAALVALAWAFANVLQARGEPGRAAIVLGGALVVQVVALAMLVPPWGLVGAALATGAGGAAAVVMFAALLALEHQRIPWGDGAKALAAAGAFALVVRFGPEGPWTTVAVLCVAAGLHVAILLMTGFLRRRDLVAVLQGVPAPIRAPLARFFNL